MHQSRSKRAASDKIQKRVLISALCLVIAAIGYWFFWHIEWIEKEIDTGYSEQARRNHFLAAEQFLQQNGLAVEQFRSSSLADRINDQDTVISTDDTLLLINGYRTLKDERQEKVWQWLQRGGHVIMSTRNDFIGNSNDEVDQLLARAGISIVPIDTSEIIIDDDADETNEADTDTPETDNLPWQCRGTEGVVSIDFSGEPDPLQARFNGKHHLIDNNENAKAWVNDDSGTVLLQYNIGEGMLTVTNSNHLWNNANIGCFDHAFLLWSLTSHQGKTWIINNQDAISLWKQLWRGIPYAMLSLSLCLLLWLWRASTRFGPIRQYTITKRRRFLEHIQANAAFLWRQKQDQQLLETLRQQVLRLMARHHQGFSQLNRNEKVNAVVNVTKLPAAEIQAALFDTDNDGTKQNRKMHSQEFVAQVQRLQMIRNRL